MSLSTDARDKSRMLGETLAGPRELDLATEKVGRHDGVGVLFTGATRVGTFVVAEGVFPNS